MKNRITRTLVVCALAFITMCGQGVAFAASPPSNAHTLPVIKPAKVDPFTGKESTQYFVEKGPNDSQALTYWCFPSEKNSSYYIGDQSGVAGDDTELGKICAVNSLGTVWTPYRYTSGTWIGFTALKNADGLCMDDPAGQDNIRITMEPCAEVGGQAWDNAIGAGGWTQWTNAICVDNGCTDQEAVTIAFGTIKTGAWIVTAPYDIRTMSTVPVPSYESWEGPGYN